MDRSEDDPDPELIALLRQSLLTDQSSAPTPTIPDTKLLASAEYVYSHSIDVALDPRGTKAAAQTIYAQMRQRGYSTKTWSTHELHPQVAADGEDNEEQKEKTVDFIFTMDLLNFCFWSDKESPEERFTVEYRGKKWVGYWSLVAALQRALEEGVHSSLFHCLRTLFVQGTLLEKNFWIDVIEISPKVLECGLDIHITTPAFWLDEEKCSDDLIRHVFRSSTDEEMPLLDERIRCLREAGRVLSNVGLTLLLVHLRILSLLSPSVNVASCTRIEPCPVFPTLCRYRFQISSPPEIV